MSVLYNTNVVLSPERSVAMVLAAGKGSRLGLKDFPKAMINVKGRPLISFCLENLYKMGFTSNNIRVVVCHNSDPIIRYCSPSALCVKTNIALGNADSLERGVNSLKSTPSHILVLQADDCLNITDNDLGNFFRFHTIANSAASIMLTRQFDPSLHKNTYCLSNDNLVKIHPSSANETSGYYPVGIYAFSSCFLHEYFSQVKPDLMHKGELTVTQLFKLAILNHQLTLGYRVKNRCAGINTPEQLEKARNS